MRDSSSLTRPFDLLVSYLAISDRPRSADVIIGFGSDCPDVGQRAAQLFHMGLSPWVMFAGGRGRLSGNLECTEAAFLKRVAVDSGLPPKSIITEEESKNTLENVRFAFAVLSERSIHPREVILVTQPVHQRRAFATAKRQFPGVHFINCPSRELSLDDLDQASMVRLAHLAVGEIDRLKRYAGQDDIVPQPFPGSVVTACEAARSLLKQVV